MPSDNPTPQWTYSQLQALTAQSAVLIQASAGSGKTSILVERYLRFLIAHLNQDKIPEILAITFTQKAAEEMKHRLLNRIQTLPDLATGERDKLITHISRSWITTIHGCASHILKQFPLQAGIDPDFQQLENDEAQFLIDQAIRESISTLQKNPDHPNHPQLLSVLQHISMESLRKTLRKLVQKQPAADLFNSEVTAIQALGILYHHTLAAYTARKQTHSALDFTDLLQLANHILQAQPDIRHYYQTRFRWIVVDEFQDTDPLQWSIIQSLLSDTDPIGCGKCWLVGDLKQAIYSFRGADMQLFKTVAGQFHAHPDAQVIRMDDNFRSTPEVIHRLNPIFRSLFQNDIGYSDLIPRSGPASSGPNTDSPPTSETLPLEISLFTEKSVHLQYQHIVRWIQAKHQSGTPFEDIAILCRRNDAIEPITTLLKKAGIPLRSDAGAGFYRKSEIQDAIHLLTGITDPTDTFAWVGILKSLFIGLSDNAIWLLFREDPHSPLPETLQKLAAYPLSRLREIGFSDLDGELIRYSGNLIAGWLQTATHYTPDQFLENGCLETGFWNRIRQVDTGPKIIANLQKLIDKLRSWSHTDWDRWTATRHILTHRVRHGDAEPEAATDTNTHGVSVMTIHQAKGLEFPWVILANLSERLNFGLTDSVLLSRNKIAISQKTTEKNHIRETVADEIRQATLEEEKRILYVAFTRAKTGLLLTGHALPDTPPSEKSPVSHWDLLTQNAPATPTHWHLPNGPSPIPIRWDPVHPNPLQESDVPRHSQSSALRHSQSYIPCHSQSSALRHSRGGGNPGDILLEEGHRLDSRLRGNDRGSGNDSRSGNDKRNTFPRQLTAQEFLTAYHPTPPPTVTDTIQESATRTLFSQLIATHTLPSTKDIQTALAPLKNTPDYDTHCQTLHDTLLRFRHSPLWPKLETALRIRPQFPFTLHTQSLLITGQIDCLYQTPEGWILLLYIATADHPATPSQLRLYWQAAIESLGLLQTKYPSKLYFTKTGLLTTIHLDEAQLKGPLS